ncbi:hypothetical protein AOA01_00250 [Listeria monocytogenes]|uniref:hypothetical protein n=1 Tax=Listeria monocytogenes TaxID=1639 RepID=UPI000775EBA5|nr:hypothetical protein [Listeria monocytogenes]EAF5877609.1 hypothetical protein [Listeria monocytogenes]EKZ4877789.1 hypothetical protein [Listeria monocytogenes]KXS65766.1 hypothetical protein AWJ02_01545 [Listeria monocytogenes]KXW92921.1 hypothetical protein AWJ00_08300 [Listeria monocytogenes]
MGIISVKLESGETWRFEVNCIEKALSLYEMGWVKIVTDENNTYVFNNDEIAYIHAEKREVKEYE